MSGEAPDPRTAAVRALELEFGSLMGMFRRIIAENADRLSPGMLPGVYKVFTVIARRESITLSTLADVLAADKGQTSRAVRELEELGLVQRTPDPADRRSQLISPTPMGLERLAAARAPQERSLLAALEDWSVDDIDDLARMLRALAAGESP
ncbi:MarR family winged helix-turn-helix transcriptional regulator [Microbacterium thalassium]|uniref:DNA-binding MarR family transcriptional regulator n=1 Tax=Microbacterium thalassium TaxID=362649 RepID=A0A7X0FSF1_9MICO|nr:MarR family transcriptional regulator [Microbacterium thalassium]MBB6392862.1 DNA-binding MarR family transcriptional regulator [Microbacterium thalassium]GLK22907.1 transcriptional regulator [Microbacterium thalassium]